MFLDFFVFIFWLQGLFLNTKSTKLMKIPCISCSEKFFATSRLCVLIEKALLQHYLA